jgi:hypothetical protein
MPKPQNPESLIERRGAEAVFFGSWALPVTVDDVITATNQITVHLSVISRYRSIITRCAQPETFSEVFQVGAAWDNFSFSDSCWTYTFYDPWSLDFADYHLRFLIGLCEAAQNQDPLALHTLGKYIARRPFRVDEIPPACRDNPIVSALARWEAARERQRQMWPSP